MDHQHSYTKEDHFDIDGIFYHSPKFHGWRFTCVQCGNYQQFLITNRVSKEESLKIARRLKDES